ncbi:hypothetical protein ACWEOW_05845 [Monashia sp. NPDC004114]
MRISTRTLTAVAVSGALALTVAVGHASAASASRTTTVSCDVTITSNLVTLNQSTATPTGVTFKQSSTSPSINSYVWATASTGNSLSAKAVTNGGTVAWAGVRPSNYTFKTHVVSSTNCNGGWPGDGNSTMSYTAWTNV